MAFRIVALTHENLQRYGPALAEAYSKSYTAPESPWHGHPEIIAHAKNPMPFWVGEGGKPAGVEDYLLNHEGHVALVGLVDGKTVAFMGGYPLDARFNPEHLTNLVAPAKNAPDLEEHLQTAFAASILFVHPDHQGNRYPDRLYAAFDRRLRDRGFTHVLGWTADVPRENSRIIRRKERTDETHLANVTVTDAREFPFSKGRWQFWIRQVQPK